MRIAGKKLSKARRGSKLERGTCNLLFGIPGEASVVLYTVLYTVSYTVARCRFGWNSEGAGLRVPLLEAFVMSPFGGSYEHREELPLSFPSRLGAGPHAGHNPPSSLRVGSRPCPALLWPRLSGRLRLEGASGVKAARAWQLLPETVSRAWGLISDDPFHGRLPKKLGGRSKVHLRRDASGGNPLGPETHGHEPRCPEIHRR